MSSTTAKNTRRSKRPARGKSAKPTTRSKTITLHIKCANCREKMFGYKTEDKTSTFTEVTYECRNPLCKITAVYAVEALRMLQKPIMLLNPELKIPLSPLVKDKRLAELDNLPVSDDQSDLKMLEQAIPQADLFFDTPAPANDEHCTTPPGKGPAPPGSG